MSIKERIDELNDKYGIESYTKLLYKIFRILGSKDPYEDARKEKSNFSQMLEGKREFNKKFFIPLEQIYDGVTIDYIINGRGTPKSSFQNKGIRYVASTNDYNEFKRLSNDLWHDNNSVIFNTDEYQKGILDYIIEYKALEGLRFLIDEYGFKYDLLRRSGCTKDFHLYSPVEQLLELADMLVEKDDADLFNKMFDTFEIIPLEVYYEENSVYLNKDFLIKILDSNNIFKSQLAVKELSIKYANMNDKTLSDQNSKYINPLLNCLLNCALEDWQKYEGKIHQILDFALVENKNVISWLNTKIDMGKVHDGYKIDKYGNVIFARYYKYGHLVNTIGVQDPTLSLDIKNKISEINELNNSVNYSDSIDYFGDNHKKTKLNKEGHILKLASKNPIEYELYEKFKDQKDAPVPTYYGMKEGVDEFSNYRGKPLGRNYTIENLQEIAYFIRCLHDLTYDKNTKNVFVHGDIDINNFYFNEEGLSEVINWDKCYKGTLFDDMMMLILRYSGMADLYRNNEKVIKVIDKLFEAYEATDNYRSSCISLLKATILKVIDNAANEGIYDTPEHIKEYEEYMWSLSFINIYQDRISKKEKK